MKIEQSTKVETKKPPAGSRKDGCRLDLLLDALTTMRAAGVPDHAGVRLESSGDYHYRTVVAHWTEER